MKRCGLLIEGLGAERALDKLTRAGIEVLAAEKPRKNALIVWTDGKERKKVFAILSETCYNIKNVRYGGAERLWRRGLHSAGMLAGAAVFLGSALFFQGRVLRIDVTGSGAYYADAVTEILAAHGTGLLSPAPKETAALSAEILALPRVSFCSLALSGGVLTVDVEVSDDGALLKSVPLYAPADGTVAELTVVRGTALVSVGDTVKKGDTVVADYAPSGGGTRTVIVIARVTVEYPVSVEYALPEADAMAQAYLDYGEWKEVTVRPTGGGTLIEGTALVRAAVNLE